MNILISLFFFSKAADCVRQVLFGMFPSELRGNC